MNNHFLEPKDATLCPNPECKAASEHHIDDPERGDVICTKCGYIVGEFLTNEREWGEYDPSKQDSQNNQEQVRASTMVSKYDFFGTDQGRRMAKRKEYRYLLKDSDLTPEERTALKKRKNEKNHAMPQTTSANAPQTVKKKKNDDDESTTIIESDTTANFTNFQTRTGFKRSNARVQMYRAADDLGAYLNISKTLIETSHFLLEKWSQSQSVINTDLWTSKELILASFLKASRLTNNGILTLKAVKTQFSNLNVRQLESYWSFFSYHIPDRSLEVHTGKKVKKISDIIIELAEKIISDFLPPDTKKTHLCQLLKKTKVIVSQISPRFDNRKPSIVAAVCVTLLLKAELIQFDDEQLCRVANVEPTYIRKLTSDIFLG